MPITQLGVTTIANGVTAGDQTNPNASLSPQGAVISYQSVEAGVSVIRLAQFNVDGERIGSDILVSQSGSTDNMVNAFAGRLADNHTIVVTWTDATTGAGYFRAYDGSTLAPINAATQVSQSSNQDPTFQGLAFQQDPVSGNILFTWTADAATSGDGAGTSIHARVFSSTFVPSNEFTVNTTTTGDQQRSRMSTLGDGNFLITYQSNDATDGAGYAIRGRVINAATGLPSGTDFIINSTTAGDQQRSQSRELADGRTLVVFDSSDTGDGNGSNIRGRFLDSHGVPQGTDFILNTTTFGNQRAPQVREFPDGRILVTWASFEVAGSGGTQVVIRARILNADGTTIGNDELLAQIPASTVAGSQIPFYNVRTTPDNRIVLTYGDPAISDGTGLGTEMRIFAASTSASDQVLTGDGTSQTLTGTSTTTSWIDGQGGNDVITMTGTGNANFYGGAGNDTLNGGVRGDFLAGGTGDDTLNGNAGNDFLSGEAGINAINGGAGRDVAVYGINSANATIVHNANGTTTISGAGFTDTLTGVEVAKFEDGTVSLRLATSSDFAAAGASNILFRNDATGDTGYYTITNGALGGWTPIGVTSAAYSAVGSGDFSGDGTSDILFRNNSNGDMGFFRMGGATPVWTPLGGSSSAYAVAGVGDFNGDSTSDILFRNNATGDFGYYQIANGVSQGWHSLGGSSTAYQVVGVGDFNGDTTSDVLYRNASTGDTGFYTIENGAIGSWHSVGSTATSYTVVGVGDFNGDGTADILFRNGTNGDMGYFQIENGGVQGWHALGSSSSAYQVVATGDYNGDGTSDILFRNAATGDSGYFQVNNGLLNSWHPIGASVTTYHVVNDGTVSVPGGGGGLPSPNTLPAGPADQTLGGTQLADWTLPTSEKLGGTEISPSTLPLEQTFSGQTMAATVTNTNSVLFGG